VIARGGVALRSGDTARAFHVAPSSMHSALKVLEERHVVRVETIRGESRYRLVDPFLPRWLALAQGL
jgi:Mn-dependent DtxR family transcriptional regulator